MTLSRRNFLTAATFAFTNTSMALTVDGGRRLRVGAFYDYSDNEAIRIFEQKTGIRVELSILENSEQAVAELVQNLSGFDIVTCSDFMLPHLVTLGLVLPLQMDHLPNLLPAALDRRFSSYGQVNRRWYGWPAGWGTTGIVYHKKWVSNPPASWQQFFNDIALYRKRVSVPDDHVSMVGIALKALGYSFNETHPGRLQEAAKLLRRIRPHIRSIDSDTEVAMKKDMIGIGWNDSAYSLQLHDAAYDFYLPLEGGELWSDWCSISAHCQDIDAAHQFLNFLLAPAQLVNEVIHSGRSPVDGRVAALLPDSVRRNTIIFPPETVLKNTEHPTQESLREPLRMEYFSKFVRNKWGD